MPTDFLRPSGLHTEPRQDQQSRHMMLLAERSLVLEGPALINAVLSGHALSGKELRNISLLASEERSLPPLADLQTPELDALVTTPAHETSQMLLPRSRVDKGLQSWQCSTCTRYVPEASIIWGTDSTNWPWRAECRACKSAQAGACLPSIRGATPSPRANLAERSALSSPRAPLGVPAPSPPTTPRDAAATPSPRRHLLPLPPVSTRSAGPSTRLRARPGRCAAKPSLAAGAEQPRHAVVRGGAARNAPMNVDPRYAQLHHTTTRYARYTH